MFCKKCGKEIDEKWTACPNCGNPIAQKSAANNEETKKKKKVRGKSNAPTILGIVGGALGIPSAVCSGMCASMAGATESTELSGELGSFYLIGILLGAAIAIIFACRSKKNPKLAGIMLLLATVIIGLLSVVTFNVLGMIAAVLTLIGAIICFVQEKECI